MAFHVGQKVARISGAKPIGGSTPPVNYSIPEVNGAVTIRTINNWPRYTLLTFEEHDNAHVLSCKGWGSIEPGFDARCFRPVVTKSIEAGMSTLRRILTDAPEKVGA